jgi:polyisoprenyl-teichoic acid--peptidoglycan teichoic acid transferase
LPKAFKTTIVMLAITACTAQPVSTTISIEAIPRSAPPVATTEAPFTLVGAPPELAKLVEDTYLKVGSAGGVLTEAIVASGRGPILPTGGEAAISTYRGSSLAVVTADGDVLGAVDDGTGWRWVAGTVAGARVFPSLPTVLAVIGSDARSGEDPTRARADSIHLVGLDDQGGAQLVGIPRDSYVPSPGGNLAKINGNLAKGGPEAMMQALAGLSGYPIDGYVLTGFDGFQEMAGNVLGPIVMIFDQPVSDWASGADFPAGEIHLNGPQALAFARNRKSLPDGDFGRQRNGGLLLIAGAVAAKLRGPLAVPGLIAGTEPWLYNDLTPDRLLELALAVHALDPLAISNTVLPGISANRGGASVVLLGSESAGILAAIPGAG